MILALKCYEKQQLIPPAGKQCEITEVGFIVYKPEQDKCETPGKGWGWCPDSHPWAEEHCKRSEATYLHAQGIPVCQALGKY